MTYATPARPRPVQQLLEPEHYGSTGPDLRGISRRALQSRRHYYSPNAVSRSQEAIEPVFRQLADRWVADTRYQSSLTAVTSHPAYRDIVALGHAAVPLILRDLEVVPRFWFPALSEITGADPIVPSQYGDVAAMAHAWLTWAEENNIRSR